MPKGKGKKGKGKGHHPSSIAPVTDAAASGNRVPAEETGIVVENLAGVGEAEKGEVKIQQPTGYPTVDNAAPPSRGEALAEGKAKEVEPVVAGKAQLSEAEPPSKTAEAIQAPSAQDSIKTEKPATAASAIQSTPQAEAQSTITSHKTAPAGEDGSVMSDGHRRRSSTASSISTPMTPASSNPTSTIHPQNIPPSETSLKSTTATRDFPASSPKQDFLSAPHIVHTDRPLGAMPFPHIPIGGPTEHISTQDILATIHQNGQHQPVQHSHMGILSSPSGPQLPPPPAHLPHPPTAPQHHPYPDAALHAPHYPVPPPPGVHPGPGVCAGGIVARMSPPPTHAGASAAVMPRHPSPYFPSSENMYQRQPYVQDPHAAELRLRDGYEVDSDDDYESCGDKQGVLNREPRGQVMGTPVSTEGYYRRGGEDVGLVAGLISLWEKGKGWLDDWFEATRR